MTSGSEEVDLADPDVRDAAHPAGRRRDRPGPRLPGQGQALDAILQLTEAEKTSTALGLDDRLATVKALLAELQG